MGHRHSPAEFGGPHGVFRAGGRAVALDPSGSEGVAPACAGFSRRAPQRPGIGVRAALLALRFYQAFLSPLMIGSCRFYPSCSRYAYEAIGIHGVARGAWLALKRLLRCHPFARGGFDPVPAEEQVSPNPEVLGHPKGTRL